MTGSGKTTMARWLGEALSLGVIELDAIRHANGWDSTPWDEFRAQLCQRLDAHPDGWVCDGSYSRISDIYLSRIDTLIWLHLPWRISFRRVLLRTLRRVRTGERVYHENGPRESLRLTFLSRNSLLLYAISHHRAALRNVRKRIAGLRPDVRVYELRTPAEVRRFQRSVEAGLQ
jgi:adenylate kinase family enzyme